MSEAVDSKTVVYCCKCKVNNSDKKLLLDQDCRYTGQYTTPDANDGVEKSLGLDQCDQIWQNLGTLANIEKLLANFIKLYLAFGKVLSPLWHNFYSLGQIFITVNS